jgi:hypothetical protein
MTELVTAALAALKMADDPENRLALEIACYFLWAAQCDDFEWIDAQIEEMKRLENLETLERLQKLHEWCRSHKAGRRGNGNPA